MNNISVVVCVKNSEATIEDCLKSIEKNDPLEIIVVDGNSTDETVKIASRYTDKIYSDEGKGLAYARQLGAEKARGDYIAYIDADTRLPNRDVLAVMLKEFKEAGWVAIHAQLVDPTPDKTYWQQGEDFHQRNRFNKPGEKRYLGTVVCLIRKDIVLKYKFDPFFKGAGEDGDFYHRVRKDGYKFGVATATAYHYHRAFFRDFVKQKLWYGEGNARALWKHKRILNLLFPVGLIPFGIWMCIKNRSIKLLPYYFVWSIFTGVGMLKELCRLVTGHANSQISPCNWHC